MKAVTGMTLTFIIGIVLGIFALFIVWLFLTGNINTISKIGDSAIKGFTCFFCDRIGVLSTFGPCGGCK